MPTLTFKTDSDGKFTSGTCSDDGQLFEAFTTGKVFLSQATIKKDLEDQFEKHVTAKHSTVTAVPSAGAPQPPAKTPDIP
jgi:hypothetical protein